MKSENLKLSRTDFPIVNSLDNLEVGRIYQTTNYAMLKPLKYNRGNKDGYVPERVAAITKMIDANEFMFGIVHVIVNLKGKAIDGNNRKRGLQERKLPVNFIITAEPRFNAPNTDSEILNNVSELNAINSAWFDKDSYLSALAFNEPTAMAIFNLKNEIGAVYGGIIEEMFTPSRIIVLATENKTGLSSQKQSRRTYCSKEIAEKINSDDFKQVVAFACNVLKFVAENNPSITPWYVIRQLMPDIWKYDLSLKVTLSNLKNRGFKKMDNTKMAGVKSRVQEILRMGNVK